MILGDRHKDNSTYLETCRIKRNTDPHALRAVRIVGDMTAPGLAIFLDRFDTLRTEDGRARALQSLSINLNTLDPQSHGHVMHFIPNLERLLNLLDRTSVDASALVRGRTMHAGCALAAQMEKLGEDPERAIRIVRKLIQDQDASYSEVAKEVLSEWERLRAAPKEKQPDSPPTIDPIAPPRADSERRPIGNPSLIASTPETAHRPGRMNLVLIGIFAIGSVVGWGVYRVARRVP